MYPLNFTQKTLSRNVSVHGCKWRDCESWVRAPGSGLDPLLAVYSTFSHLGFHISKMGSFSHEGEDIDFEMVLTLQIGAF